MVFLLLSWFSLTPALAQQPPAVVEDIKLVTGDDSRAAFMIRFSPSEPQYSAINNNPSRPEVLMRATLRAPRLAQRTSYRGLVRSATFENSASGL